MTPEDAPGRRLLVVTVGTDHHPFDRLLRWCDTWLLRHLDGIHVIVQHGTAAPSTVVPSAPLLPPERLGWAMAHATVVVSHGGPATIAEIRRNGLLPVVVPRDPARHEHVDDHQVRFARHLHRHGLIALAESEPTLHRLLDQAVAAPHAFRIDAAESDVTATIDRFRVLVEGLPPRRRGRPPHAVVR